MGDIEHQTANVFKTLTTNTLADAVLQSELRTEDEEDRIKRSSRSRRSEDQRRTRICALSIVLSS